MTVKSIPFAFLLVFASLVNAGNCDHLYPYNKEIVIKDTVELCNSSFVTRYDVKAKANIMSIEKMIPGRTYKRGNTFYRDTRVISSPSPKAYRGSGYDRAHMAPASSARTYQEMKESFLMTNITPQNLTLNRGAWRELEEYVRSIVTKPTIVMTGAIYDGKRKANDIPVPFAYYKIVYLEPPRYFYAINNENAKVYIVSADFIYNIVLTPFPKHAR